ncbi:hypothetical protein C2G38_2217980 [Gigaspora rosea]|uniref:Uncharacterized protein n=1 Tax=Gigaspora rosea TaxID=44941 RepID=A0A397U731_9GLOM|nr:hypothetical protein C2G38_2217980 [Gigaspora rosea]
MTTLDYDGNNIYKNNNTFKFISLNIVIFSKMGIRILTKLCSSCRIMNPNIAFQNHVLNVQKVLNENNKRKCKVQILNDIRKQKENSIKSKELEHIVYEKLMDNE